MVFERLVNLCWSILGWCVLLLVVCAVLGGLFFYERVDEEIRSAVQQRLAAALPDYEVRVTSARLVERQGFEVKGIRIRYLGASASDAEMIWIEEALVRCQPRLEDIVEGRLKVTRATLRGVKLRVARSAKGGWNVEPLIACPDRESCEIPLIDIENGTLEIADGRSPGPRRFVLRGVNLRIRTDEGTGSGRVSQGSGLQAGLGAQTVIEGDFGGEHLQRGTLKAILSPERQLWSAAMEMHGVQFGPEMHAALPVEWSKHLGALGPLKARGDITVRAARQLGQDAMLFDLEGQITDGRWDDPRLPFPVTDLRATISGDARGISIQDVTARYGTAALEMTVRREGYQATSPTVVEGLVRSLTFTRQAVGALPKSLQEAWQKFQPLGLVDVQFRMGGLQGAWHPEQLLFSCRDVSLRWEKFPYPLRQVTGEVRWANEELHIGLRGLAGDDAVELRGEIQNPGPLWFGWSELKSEDSVVLDERFVAAHAPKTQMLLRKFAASGRARVWVRGERLEGHLPVEKQVEVELVDTSIRHEAFPYPIHHLQGRLRMVNGHWTFRELEGQNGTGFLTGWGSWDPQRDDGRLELELEGRDIPLEDDLRIALGPRFENAWRDVRPRGTMDWFHVQFHHLPARGQRHLDVEMEKRASTLDDRGSLVSRAISILPARFPYSIEQVTGKFRYQDGLVSFHDVAGRHGPVQIGARGTLQLAGDGGWRLLFQELTAERLRGDEDLRRALPPRLSKAISGFHHVGPVAFAGMVEFVGSGADAGASESRWDVLLDLEDTSYTSGVSLDHMSGQIRLRGGSGEEFHCRGDVNLDSCVFKGTQLTAVKGPLWIDQERILFGAWAESAIPGRISPRMEARAFGGTLEGDAQVVFEDFGRFDLQATLSNADLARVVRETTSQAPQTKINGFANGVVKLSGSLQGPHTWHGGGAIRVRDADIYELPFVVLLLQQLRTGEVGRTGFDSSEMDFRINGDHAYFDRIEIRGDALTLRGAGEVGLDRQLNLKLYTVMGRDEFYIPIVRPLLGEAARRLVMIRVTGDLGDPRMVREVLPGLNESLQQFFPDLESSGEPPPAPPAPRPGRVATGQRAFIRKLR